ncbi:hypothetical protein RHMOL_Rhmol06G0052800 [Rhododendron molle]|uniref:Uncharacterized protein n=1 Tax=Rhododendron molle TaxID=49168 RepID=A0ACC0N9D5_RHOML|nr:hypothetical protein RHMOL_Rhmol06G0052800 [Rhododendron molle]
MASSTISVTRSAAFKAASDCEPRSRSSSFETIREFWIREGGIPLDTGGNTILHFLAMYGNAFVIQKLVNDDGNNNNNGSSSIVKCEDLFGRNDKGNTPLHEAARFGRKSVVEILLRKQQSYIGSGTQLLGRDAYLRCCGLWTEGCFRPSNRKGLAMSILESFPQLAQNPDEEGRTALYLLAQKSKSFKSGSFYSPHNYISGSQILSVDFLAVLTYWFIPSIVYQSKHDADVENQQQKHVNISKLKGFWASVVAGFKTVFKACRHTRIIYNEKEKHAFALELGKRLLKEEREWSRYLDDKMGSPIVEAAEKGIIELVNEILEKFPEAAYSFDKNSDNDKRKNILHIAVEQKDWNIYNLLKRKIDLRNGMLVEDVDYHGNTILHLAAKLGTPSFRSAQPGHLYQMMWDHVSYDSPPHLWYLRNSDEETAIEVFAKEHSEIREKAEKAVKDVNSGLMLIVALIGTVNYAALFTPPGGYRQSEADPLYGLLVFLTDDMRMYFFHIFSGLLAAFVAFATMFSIMSCPFRSNDFYLDLPLRLLLAMATLVLSVVFTALSSRQVYFLDGLFFTRARYVIYMCLLLLIFILGSIDPPFLILYYLSFLFRYWVNGQ